MLVGFSSSVAIVFQASTALGAMPEQIGSAFWGVVAGALAWGVQAWRR